MGACGVCMCGGGRGQHCGTILSQRNCFEKIGIRLLHMFLSMRYTVL